MKKVCLIGPFPIPGLPISGNSKALETIAVSKICNQKFEVFKIDISRELGCKNFFKKTLRIFLAVLELVRLCVNNKIDTFYLTIAQSNFGTLRDIVLLQTIFLLKKKTAKVLIHLHGGGFLRYFESANFLFKKLIRCYFSKVDNAIVLSESLKKMFLGIVPAEKIVVLFNCVDDACILPDEIIERKLNTIEGKTAFSVVYLSNLIPSKGYFDLLEAIKLLNERNYRIKAVFAGGFLNSSHSESFFKFVDEHNLSEVVSHVGFVSGKEKLSLLEKGDIFVLPTYYPEEGQPISILEAMGATMPIVTTNQGGIADVVADGVNGIIVRAKCPPDIFESIVNLMCASEFKKIALRNRNDVMVKFRESNYIDGLMRLF